MKNKTKKTKTNKPTIRGPGRPQYTPIVPRGKFTFTDFEVINGVNPETGKGDMCTTLTLRKWLKRDLLDRQSLVVHLRGVTAEPASKNGLGRKQYVYQRRSLAGNKPTVKAPAKTDTATPEVIVDVSQATKDYEAKKVELGIAVPAVTITPEAPAVETTLEPDPVAEAPTPQASIVEVTPVTESVPA